MTHRPHLVCGLFLYSLLAKMQFSIFKGLREREREDDRDTETERDRKEDATEYGCGL